MATSTLIKLGKNSWPGMLTAIILTLLVISPLITLFSYALQAGLTSDENTINYQYLSQIIFFTFKQAFLSVLATMIPALVLALALYRQRFSGRTTLLKLFTLSFMLPTLVVILGLVTIYGQHGWLANLCSFLGIHYSFSLYGLHGIIIAHVFFNLPLTCRLLLLTLEGIAVEQRQLAAQLGMNSWQRFYRLEWPHLRRQLLSISALIFMLCFSSFTIVLTLGGGHTRVTLELAIYQALLYDYDLIHAALFALLQFLFCTIIMISCYRLMTKLPAGKTNVLSWHDQDSAQQSRFFDYTAILLAILFLLPPLLAIIINGLNNSINSILLDADFWLATSTSIIIALSSSLLTLLIAIVLLWNSRNLHLMTYHKLANYLEISGMLILAMPAIVLACGLYLLLYYHNGMPDSPFIIMIIINCLMALPYVLKILTQPMYDLAERYHYLWQSLGMNRRQRFWLIDFRALFHVFIQACAFACLLSLGDFTVIAFFNNPQFLTLPYYLYQQLNFYRSEGAAVAAFLLLLLCFLVLTLLEYMTHRYDKIRSSALSV